MSFIHDTILSTLWKPIPILPIIGGYSAGPAKYLGSHFGGHSSILFGFFYRLSALLRKKYYEFFVSRSGTAVVIGIHIAFTLILCIPLYFSKVDNEIIKQQILQKYPQLGPVFQDGNVFLYDLKINPWFGYFLIAAIIAILLIPPITIGCIYAILKILQNSLNHLQAHTIKLHRQLLIALIIQIILPFILIIFPVVIVCLFIYFEFSHTSVAIQVAIICCTFHSVADTCVMTFMIAPYRKATIHLFLSIFPKKIQNKIWPLSDGKPSDASKYERSQKTVKFQRSVSIFP
uniref:Serpentine Receptor, class H n=1 Tax=Panagrolaimus sp. PS1159 TaxID=55785 RepID=A0AC35GNM2_9BILA